MGVAGLAVGCTVDGIAPTGQIGSHLRGQFIQAGGIQIVRFQAQENGTDRLRARRGTFGFEGGSTGQQADQQGKQATESHEVLVSGKTVKSVKAFSKNQTRKHIKSL